MAARTKVFHFHRSCPASPDSGNSADRPSPWLGRVGGGYEQSQPSNWPSEKTTQHNWMAIVGKAPKPTLTVSWRRLKVATKKPQPPIWPRERVSSPTGSSSGSGTQDNMAIPEWQQSLPRDSILTVISNKESRSKPTQKRARDLGHIRPMLIAAPESSRNYCIIFSAKKKQT